MFDFYKDNMSLGFHDGTVQFGIFKRIVMERFYRSDIDFSAWRMETDRNNLPIIFHNRKEVVNSGSIKTVADLWRFVHECEGSVFFN